MRNSSSSSFLLFVSSYISLLLTALFVQASATGLVEDLSWSMTGSAGGGGQCQGSIAECRTEDEMFELDSEVNRRILATTQYISYGALQRDTVPCSQRGASYYNCQAGSQANPYNRGCSAITRCRS